jgi:hypothetical protein
MPKSIKVQIRCSNITSIDTVHGKAAVEVTVRSTWPLKKSEIEEVRPTKARESSAGEMLITGEDWPLWRPHLALHNLLRSASHSIFLEYFVDERAGTVTQKMEVQGAISIWSDVMDFPFDAGVLRIVVRSETHDADDLMLEWDEGLEVKRVVGHANANGPADFIVGLPRIFNFEAARGYHAERSVSCISVVIPVRRRAAFFVQRILFMMSVLHLMGLATFYIPIGQTDRVMVVVSLLLSMTAFQWTIADMIPRVSYLTAVDKALVVAFLTYFTEFITTVLMQRMTDMKLAATLNLIIGLSLLSLTLFYLIFLFVSARRRQIAQFVPHTRKQDDIFGARSATRSLLARNDGREGGGADLLDEKVEGGLSEEEKKEREMDRVKAEREGGGKGKKGDDGDEGKGEGEGEGEGEKEKEKDGLKHADSLSVLVGDADEAGAEGEEEDRDFEQDCDEVGAVEEGKAGGEGGKEKGGARKRGKKSEKKQVEEV